MEQYVSRGLFDRKVKFIEEKLRYINNNDLLNRLQAEHDYFIEQLRNTELNLEELIEQIEQSGGDTNQKLNDLINSYNNFKANTLRINDVFDADGQFDGSRIRPLSVETAALTVGQRSQQLSLNGIEFKLDPYATSGGGVLKWRSTSNSGAPNTNNIAGLMFHYGYGTNTDPKIYLIYEGSHSFTSTDVSKGFHIYAIIPKTSNYIYTEPSTVSEEYFNGYFELLYNSSHTKIYNGTLPTFDSTKEYYIEVNDKKEAIIIDNDNFRKNLVGLYYKNGDTYSLVLTDKPTYSSTTKYCTKKSNDIPAENGSSTSYNGETISYNNTATILVTIDKIPSEGDNNHTEGMYIQLGYVSVELSAGNTNNSFYRKVDMTYGQTTINGRLITTGRIEGNGAYFDLDTGDIGGTIKFKENNSYVSYNDYIDSKINDYNTTLNNTVIKDLKKQVDGAIDTWFYDYMPVHSTAGAPDSTTPLNVVPYKTWNDIDTAAGNNNEKIKHLGDVFYDNTSGYAFRFSNTGTEQSPIFVWETITDSAVIKALADAATAQATADGKLTIFASQPTIDYKIGDLWNNAVYSTETTYSYDGETYNTPYNNVLLVCIRNRVNNTFSITDWIPSDRSIKTADQSLAQAAAANGEVTAIKNGTTTIAGGMVSSNLIELKNIINVTKQFDVYSGEIYYKRLSNKTVNGTVVKRFIKVTTGGTYPNYNLYEIAQQGDINTIAGIIVTSESAPSGTSATFKATQFHYGGGEPGFVTSGLSGIENFPCFWSGGDEVQAANYILFKKAWNAAVSPNAGSSYIDYKWYNSGYFDFIYDWTEFRPSSGTGTGTGTYPIWKRDSQSRVTKVDFVTALMRFNTYKREGTCYSPGSTSHNMNPLDTDADIPRLPVVIIDFDGFCKFGDFYIYNSQVYYNNASGFGHYALTLNGTQNGSGTSLGSFYAPTSAGTPNQLLVANSSGIPSWKATASGAAYATSNNGALTFGTLPIAQGGTGQTSQANINKAFIGALGNGTSDVTDGTEFVSSYASDNGFSDSNAVNIAYKRSFLKVWDYIKSKMSSDSAVNITGNAATATDADTLDGYHATRFTDYNENTAGNNVNYNALSYNRGTALTIQPLHAPNYSGQTNVPFNDYGQILTFGGYNTYFPFRIAYGYSSGGIKYQSAGYITASSFNFGSNSWKTILTSENYSSYALPRYNSNLTAGYIPKLSTTGQTDLANSIIFENSTGIGISTTPSHKFHVLGTSAYLQCGTTYTKDILPDVTGTNYSVGTYDRNFALGCFNVLFGGNNNNTWIRSNAASGNSYGIVFGYGGGNVSTTLGKWTYTGLGIGTTSPAYKLDVNGGIKSSASIYSIGAGEHYVEAQNTTSSLRVIIDATNSQQGLWTNGYWNGSSFVSSSLWMLYRTTDGHLILGSNTETKGNFWATGGVTALQTSSSDKRLKKEIKPFNAKQIIDKLNPVEFEWNKKANKYNSNLELNKKNYGLIAQDSDGIIDNFVFDLPDGKGYKGVRYEKLIPILLQAVKEQQKEIDELKKLVKK